MIWAAAINSAGVEKIRLRPRGRVTAIARPWGRERARRAGGRSLRGGLPRGPRRRISQTQLKSESYHTGSGHRHRTETVSHGGSRIRVSSGGDRQDHEEDGGSGMA